VKCAPVSGQKNSEVFWKPEKAMSKRREFSAEFKMETVLEGLRGEKSVA
jgi:hypothetical protein